MTVGYNGITAHLPAPWPNKNGLDGKLIYTMIKRSLDSKSLFVAFTVFGDFIKITYVLPEPDGLVQK